MYLGKQETQDQHLYQPSASALRQPPQRDSDQPETDHCQATARPQLAGIDDRPG